ncbi:MAG TPA: hypothetical protein VMD51_03540 [Mycobacterium sp.]|nr:hypothetical protein [Mycobacterium sp.]
MSHIANLVHASSTGLVSRWITAARSPFVVRPPEERPAHSRYVPRHNDYLETAAMRRAMERL